MSDVAFVVAVALAGLLPVNTAHADPWDPNQGPGNCVPVAIPDGVGCPVTHDCTMDPGQPSCFPRAYHDRMIKCWFISWQTWNPCEQWGYP